MDKTMCSNVELANDMKVTFREKIVTLKEAIDNCKAGEPIEGIHPFQYGKLIQRFETERKKQYQYSVDIKYGDWRFILFDINKSKSGKSNKPAYINPKYDNVNLPEFVRPKSLPSYLF